jgi:hypothetical protein
MNIQLRKILRGRPFWKRVFPLNPRHRGSLFPKTFKSFGKMAWKKPFFKRVSSKISARLLTVMTLPLGGRAEKPSVAGQGEGAIWPRIYRAVYLVPSGISLFLFSILLVSILLVSGCSYLGLVSYPTRVQEKKQLLASGNFNKAVQSLERGAHSGNSQVLNLMEQSMVRNIQGDYKDSLFSFKQALSLIQGYDDRAVVSARSVSSQMLTLPLNDNAISYYGYPFERVLVNTYQAMNYLFLGNPQEARVEVRQADQRQTKELERHNKEVSEYQKWGDGKGIDLDSYPQVQKVREEMQDLSGSNLSSFQNAFTYYLSGVIYELNGEANDAYIDYKKAYTLSPDCTYVQEDLLRLSRKLGFQEEYAEWASRFKDLPTADYENEASVTGTAGKSGSSNRGAEVILFYGAGFISQKQQIKLTIPIHKSLVSIALPAYTALSVHREDGDLLIQALDSETLIGTSSQVVNLDTLAIKALQEQYPIILTRQIARVISKTIVGNQAQKDAGNLGFIAASLYNVISENADLRNWLLLPNNIQILRKRVAAGNHEFNWRLQTRSGQVQNTQKTSVTLKDGDTCLVNLRSIGGRLFCSIAILHQS